jgi:hypothetical protein
MPITTVPTTLRRVVQKMRYPVMGSPSVSAVSGSNSVMSTKFMPHRPVMKVIGIETAVSSVRA